MFLGRGSAHNGRTMPILRKTQLDHDINLPPKFYQDRIKTHGAMLGTDRQTDIQTDRQTDTQTDRQAGRRRWPDPTTLYFTPGIAEISKSISSLNIDRIESNFLHNV